MAGIVFAAALEAGVRVLGRVWKVRPGFRLVVVVLLFVTALIGFFAFAGVQLAIQFAHLKATITTQTGRVPQLAAEFCIQTGNDPLATLKAQIGGSIGQITSVLGSAAGALGGLLLIVTFGIFIAADPQIYARGIAWLTPEAKRDEF
jgi:predicted PurR-regulated permease PerM